MSLARAIETGDLAELPSRRSEDWHWTDLRGLVRALPAASSASGFAPPPGPFSGLEDEEVLIVNGRGPSRLSSAAGRDRVTALRLVAAPGAGAHVSRLSLDVEAGQHLTVLESYESYTSEYISEFDLRIELAANATLDRIVLAPEADDAILVSRAEATLAPGASLSQVVVAHGGKRLRLETVVRGVGEATSVRLDGLYRLSGRRHADISTTVVHDSPGGATDQLIRGVVDDQARGVFQGRILVQRGADGTDARMKHDALVLSDRAEVDAKPELEIYADDVACAHGNTIGALDEEALFYAAARGIPPDEARAMLIAAFFEPVVDRIESAAVRDRLRQVLGMPIGVSA